VVQRQAPTGAAGLSRPAHEADGGAIQVEASVWHTFRLLASEEAGIIVLLDVDAVACVLPTVRQGATASVTGRSQEPPKPPTRTWM